MSMTLLLWKAPVIDDEDEAKLLTQAYYEREDDSAFAPSPDLERMLNELLERYPDGKRGPWADFPPEHTGRILVLSLSWSADPAALDAIEELARKYQLVLYDPQGPNVGTPTDPALDEPTPGPRLRDYLTFVAIGAAAAGVFWLGWSIDVPVLRWILMLIGGFFVAVVLFLFGAMLFAPKE